MIENNLPIPEEETVGGSEDFQSESKAEEKTLGELEDILKYDDWYYTKFYKEGHHRMDAHEEVHIGDESNQLF